VQAAKRIIKRQYMLLQDILKREDGVDRVAVGF